MSDRQSITLSGSPGSPYTRKMLALLRYRRVPYSFLLANSPASAGLPQPKVRLLPTFYLPDETGTVLAVVDSTPLIRRLEREAEGRSVLPADPGLGFIDELIEDYADEWLTKAMFHYRWAYADDIERASRILPAWSGLSIPDAVLAQRGAAFSQRQIDRLYVVGSNPVTGPVIEASYRRFLEILEAHLTHQPFLLGKRPAASDFAVYGQLTQLAQFDPTPMALTLQVAPRVFAWVSLMEDTSGLEPQEDDWTPLADQPATLAALLAEMGRVYGPVMLANEAALASGAAEVKTTVDGLAWSQSPFPYQAKCLTWLRAAYAKLDNNAKNNVDPLLAQGGLAGIFA